MLNSRIILLFVCGLIIFPINISAQSQNTAAAHYERGRYFMGQEDWYSAIESFMESIRLNRAHAEATAALAECYYELAEFDEALNWVRRARTLSRADMSIANLEVFILTALGQIDAASALVSDILAREPYNREALFAAGELDIARNRPSQAVQRYREAVRRFPDDRRLQISLALVTLSLGDRETSLNHINQALRQHSGDYRVYYYAAYIYAQNDRLNEAIRFAETALLYRPNHLPTLSLMATLRYRNSQFDEAIRLADRLIAANRDDMSAWYLKGLSLTRLNRHSEAISVLSSALAINEDNEFIRAVLEDALITSTQLEDPRRARWASWHFNKAREFRSRHLSDQAIFQYRRGLRLNPFARERRDYAELLRLSGFPSRYLEELRFLQDQGMADRSLNDAVEAYGSLLSGALFRRWRVDPIEVMERHWKIAVFSVAGQSSYRHADAGVVTATLVRDILVHDRNITPVNLPVRQASFSAAYRQAREAGADYFMIVSVTENERDISIRGELFVGRTGSPAATFGTFRTGPDRLRNASRGITEQLSASLPFRGRLIRREQGQAVINKGKADGVTTGTVYDVVKRGRAQIANDGIALVYSPDELVGRLTITNVDEEIAVGTLARNGFFDRIEAGDEIILQREETARPHIETAANPELRALLRALR